MIKNIQWFPGHMAKAKRKIIDDLALVDLSIIVLDARVPFASYNKDFDPILESKPRVIVLNKEDLAEPAVTKKWVDYYKSRGFHVVTLNAARKQGIDKLLKECQKAAEPVMLKLEAKGRARRPVRALVVGAPNTGKSTLINAIMPKSVARTENKPGVTRGRQWVRINDKIELVDTPGVLMPKFDNQTVAMFLSYCGSIPQDIYDGEEVAQNLLVWLQKNRPERLVERYKVEPAGKELPELIEEIGRKRGLIGPGGAIKEREAVLLVLSEFRSGKLGRVSLDNPEALI